MNKEYLKRLFDANWTLEEVEDFKAQVIADHEEKAVSEIIEIVRDWVNECGVQSKTSSPPEQFMCLHMALHVWRKLEIMLKNQNQTRPQGGGTV